MIILMSVRNAGSKLQYPYSYVNNCSACEVLNNFDIDQRVPSSRARAPARSSRRWQRARAVLPAGRLRAASPRGPKHCACARIGKRVHWHSIESGQRKLGMLDIYSAPYSRLFGRLALQRPRQQTLRRRVATFAHHPVSRVKPLHTVVAPRNRSVVLRG